MTEDRALTARQDGCRSPGHRLDARIADRVHARMHSDEQALVDSAVDRPLREADRQQLRSGDVTMLSRRDLGYLRQLLALISHTRQ
jgi:hypothetical protein